MRVTRLWPRSLVNTLTDADRRALVNLAVRETRHKDQTIEVAFDSESGALTGSSSRAP